MTTTPTPDELRDLFSRLDYARVRDPSDPDHQAGAAPPTTTGQAGQRLEQLRLHQDTRGALVELHRDSWCWEQELGRYDGVAQVYLSLTYPGTAKGWHLHGRQTDRWVLVRGRIVAALCDLRGWPRHPNGTPEPVPEVPLQHVDVTWPEVQEVSLDSDLAPRRLCIPPGVAHGWYNPGPGVAWVLNLTTHEYDGTDEFRRPADAGPAPGIPYDWRRCRDG